MLELFRLTKHSVLGIDISSTSITLVEVSGKEENRILENYGYISIPSTAVDGHLIKDTDAVAHRLKLLLTKTQVTSKKIIISVPDSTVISHVLQISNGLSDAEIEEIILMDADKYIPFPIEEINLDFDVLGTSSKNPAMLDVLIVASRSENINSRLEVVAKAGLHPIVVDVESFAIERAVKLLCNEFCANTQDKIIAVVDIGAVFANLFVLYNMKSMFTHEEEFGGRQLIHTLQEDVQHATDLSTYIDAVIVHIKRGLQFFFSTSQYSCVDYLLLVGEVATIPNIAQLVQEKINITTVIADPFKYLTLGRNVSTKVHKEAPMLITACGLALRQVN